MSIGDSKEEDSEVEISESGTMRPPYRIVGWYDDFFSLATSRRIDLVNLDFITTNIAKNRSDAGKFLSGLKFLGLVNEKGMATEKMSWLGLSGEEGKMKFATIIREAYADVLKTVVLDRVSVEQFVNYFISTYGFSPNSAAQSVKLFVYFAKKAGLTLSPELAADDVNLKPRRTLESDSRKDLRKMETGITPRKKNDRISESWNNEGGSKNVQATISMNLDSQTPIEIWKLVLKLLSPEAAVADQSE